MKLKKKELIGFVGLVIMIIIPLMSLSVVDSTTDEKVCEIAPNDDSYFEFTLEGGHWTWSLMDTQYAYHDYLMLNFISSNILDVWVFEYETFVDYVYWDDPYVQKGRAYAELALHVTSGSAEVLFDETDEYVIVWYNPTGLWNEVETEISEKTIHTKITKMNLNYLDTDFDTYYDNFDIYIELGTDYDVSFSYSFEYSCILLSSTKAVLDVITEQKTMFTAGTGVAFTVSFDLETNGTFYVRLETYYAALVHDDIIFDHYQERHTDIIYTLGHGNTTGESSLGFLWIFPTLLIMSILVVRKEK